MACFRLPAERTPPGQGVLTARPRGLAVTVHGGMFEARRMGVLALLALLLCAFQEHTRPVDALREFSGALEIPFLSSRGQVDTHENTAALAASKEDNGTDVAGVLAQLHGGSAPVLSLLEWNVPSGGRRVDSRSRPGEGATGGIEPGVLVKDSNLQSTVEAATNTGILTDAVNPTEHTRRSEAEEDMIATGLHGGMQVYKDSITSQIAVTPAAVAEKASGATPSESVPRNLHQKLPAAEPDDICRPLVNSEAAEPESVPEAPPKGFGLDAYAPSSGSRKLHAEMTGGKKETEREAPTQTRALLEKDQCLGACSDIIEAGNTQVRQLSAETEKADEMFLEGIGGEGRGEKGTFGNRHALSTDTSQSGTHRSEVTLEGVERAHASPARRSAGEYDDHIHRKMRPVYLGGEASTTHDRFIDNERFLTPINFQLPLLHDAYEVPFSYLVHGDGFVPEETLLDDAFVDRAEEPPESEAEEAPFEREDKVNYEHSADTDFGDAHFDSEAVKDGLFIGSSEGLGYTPGFQSLVESEGYVPTPEHSLSDPAVPKSVHVGEIGLLTDDTDDALYAYVPPHEGSEANGIEGDALHSETTVSREQGRVIQTYENAAYIGHSSIQDRFEAESVSQKLGSSASQDLLHLYHEDDLTVEGGEESGVREEKQESESDPRASETLLEGEIIVLDNEQSLEADGEQLVSTFPGLLSILHNNAGAFSSKPDHEDSPTPSFYTALSVPSDGYVWDEAHTSFPSDLPSEAFETPPAYEDLPALVSYYYYLTPREDLDDSMNTTDEPEIK